MLLSVWQRFVLQGKGVSFACAYQWTWSPHPFAFFCFSSGRVMFLWSCIFMAGSILILEATKMLNWRLEFEVLVLTHYAGLWKSIPHSLRLVAVQQTILLKRRHAPTCADMVRPQSCFYGPWRSDPRLRWTSSVLGDLDDLDDLDDLGDLDSSVSVLPRSQEKFLKSQQSAWMVQAWYFSVKTRKDVKTWNMYKYVAKTC